jgi:phosphoribosylaminoimidazole carboxylase (NCAIR synthetase)
VKSNQFFPTVGIIGSGQIARMLLEASSRLNIKIKILSNNAEESAALISNSVTIGNSKDFSDLSSFASQVDVITFDTNDLSIGMLRELENNGTKFNPRISTIENIQRIDFVKLTLIEQDLPVNGDNSKHNRLLAVQAVRSEHGQTVVYSVVEIKKIANILDEVIAPAPNLSEAKASELQVIALRISKIFDITGVFTTEFLDIGNNEFVISDIKLGPANSGHWTIDGAKTSQFENHLRAILNLPLGSPTLLAPTTVMVNVFGGKYLDMYKPFLHCMAHDPELRIHLYGKEVKDGIKVGHVNVSGHDLENLLERAHHAADYLTGRITE